jgi:hypothetical protein
MLALRDHVRLTDTEYGAVLLDARSGDYWRLNPTAALVLRTLLDGGDLEQAVAAMVDQYEVDEQTAAVDVSALVDELRSVDLVRS